MECVEGVRKADTGRTTVLGLDPARDTNALQARIGVQLQQARLQKRIRVWEAVDLWASLYPRTVDGRALLEQLVLTEKRNASFMSLSGGQKQRLFIALALINDPEVVFLDELTTGLDPQARRAICDLVNGIRSRGKTVLTTHLMEEAERLCDRVAILEHGRLIAMGAPADLLPQHCPERGERMGFVIASMVGTATFAQLIGGTIFYPMLVVSGMFVPLSSMPRPWALLASARGAWVGAGWLVLLPHLGALGLTIAICLALTARVFRWE
jgi:ABC-type Na+ transport system ATPase subunit NatA